MDIIFMNSATNKTSILSRILINLSDKTNLKRSNKCVALIDRSICSTWENLIKS